MTAKAAEGGVITLNLFNITVVGMTDRDEAYSFLEPLPLLNLSRGRTNPHLAFGKVSPPGVLQVEIDGQNFKLILVQVKRVIIEGRAISIGPADQSVHPGRTRVEAVNIEGFQSIEFICEPPVASKDEPGKPSFIRSGVRAVVLRGGVPPQPVVPRFQEPVAGVTEGEGAENDQPKAPEPEIPVIPEVKVVKVPEPESEPNSRLKQLNIGIPLDRVRALASGVPPRSMVPTDRSIGRRITRVTSRADSYHYELENLLKDIDPRHIREFLTTPQGQGVVISVKKNLAAWRALAEKLGCE